MSEQQFHFFRYDHAEREFLYLEKIDQNLVALMQDDVSIIPSQLAEIEFDALLVLDYNTSHWYLAYREALGIVGERTARRQADSIRRSGFNMADGYWVKEPRFPLTELSDPDLGDLWKTVQNKYLHSDLQGLELDAETGIPKQIKERAERLKSAGHEDALTDAKLELEEAENRKKAMAKSASKTKRTKKGTVKKPASKSKKPTKGTATKVGTVKKTSTIAKPKAKPEPKTAKTTKLAKVTKATKSDKSYLEVAEIVEYVKEGFTQIVCKGNLTPSSSAHDSAYVNLSQSKLSNKEWNEVAIFLGEGDIIEITTEISSNVTYATSIKV